MEAQAEMFLCQLCHRENGLDASIATMEEETQGSNSFPSASVSFEFCFHGDISNGSSTEEETETEEKGKSSVPSVSASSQLIRTSTRFTVT